MVPRKPWSTRTTARAQLERLAQPAQIAPEQHHNARETAGQHRQANARPRTHQRTTERAMHRYCAHSRPRKVGQREQGQVQLASQIPPEYFHQTHASPAGLVVDRFARVASWSPTSSLILHRMRENPPQGPQVAIATAPRSTQSGQKQAANRAATAWQPRPIPATIAPDSPRGPGRPRRRGPGPRGSLSRGRTFPMWKPGLA